MWCGTGIGPLPGCLSRSRRWSPCAGPRRAAPIQQALRSRVPAKRAEAFRELKSFPPDKVAKMLVQSGLGDPEPEVRRAVCEVLRSDEGVCRVVLKSLEKQTRAASGPEVAVPLIAALLVSDSEAIRDGLGDIVDKWRAKSSAAVVALIALADGLGTAPTSNRCRRWAGSPD